MLSCFLQNSFSLSLIKWTEGHTGGKTCFLMRGRKGEIGFLGWYFSSSLKTLSLTFLSRVARYLRLRSMAFSRRGPEVALSISLRRSFLVLPRGSGSCSGRLSFLARRAGISSSLSSFLLLNCPLRRTRFCSFNRRVPLFFLLFLTRSSSLFSSTSTGICLFLYLCLPFSSFAWKSAKSAILTSSSPFFISSKLTMGKRLLMTILASGFRSLISSTTRKIPRTTISSEHCMRVRSFMPRRSHHTFGLKS
mmetsp:Transcript_22215/g.45402  ORF Transcript_22215/g.45402 Transcript_22215/m.45402 type:complete len:249 (-) Transcript_22215:188-934(-)